MALRPLTILAGANSSGKSSLLQGMLLLKQTFDLTSDPGPLYIAGPHVVFDHSKELLWRQRKDRRSYVRFGFRIKHKGDVLGVEMTFKPRSRSRGAAPFILRECKWQRNAKTLSLTPRASLSTERIAQFLESDDASPRKGYIRPRRAFLVPQWRESSPDIARRFEKEVVTPLETTIRQLIHIPALRGNPTRTYPILAYSTHLTGSFLDYIATILATWQRERDEKRQHLQTFLQRLQLTWKVEARQRTSTELEIRVGRTRKAQRGGAYDLVNIVDVGFGVSQVMPILIGILAASPGETVYIEQPEIHLHPEAQVMLARILAQVVAERQIQLVLETHSQLMLIAFQYAIAKGDIPADDVILHWFTRDEEGATTISSTEFRRDGAFQQPEIPIDFSDVAQRILREYLEAAWETETH